MTGHAVLRPADLQRPEPALGTVLAPWALAGLGTAYQLGALATFIRSPAEARGPAEAPGPAEAAGPAQANADRASALAFAQAGLVAAQCVGLVMAGAAAQLLGPRVAVTLAGLCGLAASSALTRMRHQAR